MLGTGEERQMGKKNRSALLSLVAVAVSAVAGLLVGGCGIVGDKYEYTECECPTAEQLAARIDWIGNGQNPDSLSSYGVEGLHHINLTYSSFADFVDASAAYGSLIAVLRDAGINPDGVTRGNAFSLELMLEPPFAGEDGKRVVVGVRFGGPDRTAEEALASLVDALGTLD